MTGCGSEVVYRYVFISQAEGDCETVDRLNLLGLIILSHLGVEHVVHHRHVGRLVVGVWFGASVDHLSE